MMNEATRVSPLADQTRAPQDILSAASRYSKSQKGAIIIALLGAEHAKPLVDGFDDQHLQSFVTAMQTIQFTPRPILLATIAEFINTMRENNSGLRGGEEPARALAEALLSSERATRIFGDASAGSAVSTLQGGNIWDKLRGQDPEKFATYLDTQRFELVSFVLSKLDSVKAGEILAALSDDMAEAAARHMATSPVFDADIETAIEELLRIEFLEREEVDDGSETASFLADVFGVLPKSRRDKLMDIMQADNPEAAEKIKRGLLTFEDLPERLPKTAVPLIFRDMDPKDLRSALKAGQDMEPKTVEFLFANISQRMAEQYKEEVDDLAALASKEADAAIIALMSFISRLEKSGTISYIDVVEPDA